jgi:hypothetical protein
MVKLPRNWDDLEEVVEQEVVSQGYIYPSSTMILDIPEEDKALDLRLSEIPQTVLLDKLSVYTALFSAASIDEARFISKKAALEKDLDIAEAEAFQHSLAATVAAKERDVSLDPKVIEIQQAITVADYYLQRYSAFRKDYDKICMLYSRAITVQSEEKKLQ